MLALIRAIMRFKDREHLLRTNYHREHPHFPIYMAIDAILSAGLVFGAIQLGSTIASANPNQVMLTHVGGVVLSDDQLASHVPLPIHKGATRYWLGAQVGASYTTNCITPGVLKVTYLAKGQELGDGTTPLMAITAFENESLHASGLHELQDFATTTSENTRGDLLIFDDSMQKLTISRTNSAEIVVIDYSNPQGLPKMILDSENLLALD